MIRISDFRCMRKGVQLTSMTANEAGLIKPISMISPKKASALLLLHGFSSSPAVFRHFLPKLTNYDALIAPLLPTHGEDLTSFATMKGTNLLDFVENLTKNLLAEYEQVDVLGLSLGGLLALHLTKCFNFRKLFLLAPAVDLQLNLNSSLLLARFLYSCGFRQLRSLAGNLCNPKAFEIAYKLLPLATIKELLYLIKNFEFTLPSCPTEVFLGKHDEVVSSLKVASRFAGSDAKVHWLPNSAHVLPLDSDWPLILQSLEAGS